jgi:hypothetical protein
VGSLSACCFSCGEYTITFPPTVARHRLVFCPSSRLNRYFYFFRGLFDSSQSCGLVQNDIVCLTFLIKYKDNLYFDN